MSVRSMLTCVVTLITNLPSLLNTTGVRQDPEGQCLLQAFPSPVQETKG